VGKSEFQHYRPIWRLAKAIALGSRSFSHRARYRSVIMW
jgi:hypothetical protein